ncbi:MAG: hypothetical protein MUF01_07375 [Bryobacterales bacterium]|jgi:hypothetical protein|nr:hypothetical protein [Bryobacterales bacterium]
MRIILGLALLLAMQTSGQENWQAVRELPSGTEIRLLQEGQVKPLLAVLEEATDEVLRVAVKKQQLSIDRAEVRRIEARRKGAKPTTRTETIPSTDGKGPVPGSEIPGPIPPGRGPSGSIATTVAFGGKGKFETVYTKPKQ